MKGKNWKKLMLLGLVLFGLGMLALPAGAQVNVQVQIQMPPALIFSSPPQVVVLPGTYIYVVPDIDQDVFFFEGWWWRPWNGHWYRSQYYDRGWGYYSSTPGFYREVPQDWRNEYRSHQWRGQPWQYERIPHDQVQKNWNSWERDKYWEKQKSWGVQGYKNNQQPQVKQAPAHVQQPQVQQNQGHVQQNNQPKGQTQSSQGHQVQTQQSHNQQPQNAGKGGSKGDSKGKDK